MAAVLSEPALAHDIAKRPLSPIAGTFALRHDQFGIVLGGEPVAPPWPHSFK